MASTLTTKGYKLPQDGDKGDTFFDDINFNTERMNGHTHDGVDSMPLTSRSATSVSASIASGSWAATSGGTYKQTVTLPTGFTFDACVLSFRIASGSDIGAVIYPTVVKQSSTTFDVYINDSSVGLTLVVST